MSAPDNEPGCPYGDCPGDGLTCHHPTEHTITADAAPALFYLGTDGTLYQLDYEAVMPGEGGEWTLDASDREQALCRALLEFAMRRFFPMRSMTTRTSAGPPTPDGT